MVAPPQSLDALVASLSAGSLDQCRAWIAQQRPAQVLPIIEALKQHSDSLLTSDPVAADHVTRCALLVADHAPDEPLVNALAAWARGNWQAYHEPRQAIDSYQRAVAGYQVAGDHLSIGRLQSNLIFAYTDCGRLPEAETAYHAAQRLLHEVGKDGLLYPPRSTWAGASSPTIATLVRWAQPPRRAARRATSPRFMPSVPSASSCPTPSRR